MTKLLIFATIAVAVIVALLQFSSANTINASHSFFDTRMDVYLLATNAVSTVAVSEDLTAVSKAKEIIQRLIAGPILLVGDERVIWALSLFSTCMDDPINEKCSDRDLKQLSTGLSRAMRSSLNIAPVEAN